MKILGVIPARFASTRFPGKSIVDINGKPMIQHVYEQALKATSLAKVLVATDDERIASAVKKFNGNVVMTSSAHESGTDRCFEALKKCNEPFDAVINIQGDEPFIQPEQINKLANCFSDAQVQIATLVMKAKNEEELSSPNMVKAFVNKNNVALYFSRKINPIYKGKNRADWQEVHDCFKHIGIYGYRTDVLGAITKLPRSTLEIAESLEQLRWLENEYKITIGITDLESIAIDTPEDLTKALLKFPTKK